MNAEMSFFVPPFSTYIKEYFQIFCELVYSINKHVRPIYNFAWYIFCDFSMKPLDRCEKSFFIEQVSTYKKNTLHSHGERTLSPMKWQQVWQMMEYIRRWWPIFNAFVFYATKNVRFQWILEQPWHLWTLFNKKEFS